LKTPSSPQPCSSSPISSRSGSAESVVLPGAGEAEEDGDVLAVLRDVRGAVHGHDALERQPVVHQREDGLLDLAAVEGAPTRISPRDGWRQTKTSVRVPSCAGSASTSGS
jgi:hypothetical protein